MRNFIFYLTLCLFILPLMSPAVSYTAEHSAAYTDKDLNKYRNPADDKPSITPIPDKHTAKKIPGDDKKNREYYCKEGIKRNKIVNKAKDRVQPAETVVAKRQDEADHKPSDRKAAKRLADARKKLAKEQKKLAQEEAALSAFENQAHRKGIPPGWLKCNFDY